jgi:hypothetical protein
MGKHFDAYREGWEKGDAAMILGAVADDFVYDDPASGRLTKVEFAAYLEAELGGEGTAGTNADEQYETISDVVIQEKDGEEMAWAWWKTGSEEGAELVKSGPDGVHLDKLAYYTRPASM